MPATSADTAALVALLADDRPTRLVADYALPRPLGDLALEALGAQWHVDWRWLVVDDPTVAAVLPPIDRVLNPELRSDLGDDWLWSQTAWTPERRAVIIAAILRWWHGHGAAGESPIVASFRTLPLALWSETLADLPAGMVADARLGDAVAARLRQIPPPDPDGRMQYGAVQGILAAAIRFPAHAGLTAALAAWPPVPWLAAMATIRSEFAGDGAAFDRWLAAGLAHSLPPRQLIYDETETTPWGCIGLWAHHPTAQRLETLRHMLAGAVDDVRMVWVLQYVGAAPWLVHLDRRQEGRSEIRSQRAQAIPCALALDGVRDQRSLGAKALTQLAGWSGTESQDLAEIARHLPGDARVCDWVAARLFSEDTVLPTNPRDASDALTYLTAPLAQREAAIARLIQVLEPQALSDLRAAGLAAPAPGAASRAGAADF